MTMTRSNYAMCTCMRKYLWSLIATVFFSKNDRLFKVRHPTGSHVHRKSGKKGKGSPYSITDRRVPELIPVLCSQPVGDMSHKPGSRLSLLSSKPAVTLATLKRAAANFPAWWTEVRWVWTVCLRLLPDSVAAAIWTKALLRLSPAR